MSAHAKLAPSAAHRWLNCPGSVNASRGMENVAGVAAAEGTAAHALGAHCMVFGFDAARWAGGAIDGETIYNEADADAQGVVADGKTTFAIDEEMVDGVQLYLDECRKYVNGRWEHEVEQRLDLSSVHPDIFGTGDFLSYNVDDRHLVVQDFKYGKGHAVEVLDNEQLLTYALGAMLRYHNRGVDKITLIVVQPRCPHKDGPVRSVEYDLVDMIEFKTRLRLLAAATDDPNAPRVPGDHCFFCPAAAVCPEARAKVLATAECEFDLEPEVVAQEVTCMQSARVAAVLKEADFIKNWIKRVEEFAHSEAMSGRKPDGFKLVAKRATRKWKNQEEAYKYLFTVCELEGADIMNEPKMKSPAQIETAIGRKRKGEIAGLWEPKSSGTNLVPADDPRAEVSVADAETEFMEVME